MKHGICTVSVAPLRAENSDRAEMVSQLLFGEKVEILKVEPKWLFVKSKFDGYQGWTDPKLVTTISEEEFNHEDNLIFASDLFNLITEKNVPTTITIASHLVNINNNKINIADKEYDYLGDFIDAKNNNLTISEIAQMYINTPYLWGGKSSFGIDCSGLTQQVFKLKNIILPRDAYQQAEIGEVLSFVEEAEAGDLAYFDNEEGHITHVGIILKNQQIIHAHGKVRIDPIDSTGIFNTDGQYYSHKLRFIRRLS